MSGAHRQTTPFHLSNFPNKMEDNLNGVVPCSSRAVESIIRIGTAGAIWGACLGPYDAREVGLTGLARASFVGKTIGKFSLQCGYVAGVFTFTQCGIGKYRNKDDWVNALVAGAVAGAAAAVGTRSWSQLVGTAGIVSAFSVLADYSRTF